MPDELFDFRWRITEGGHKWIWDRQPGSACVEPMLTDGVPSGRKRQLTLYPPLKECPNLFLTFADTSPTKKGILAFADEYGLLGDGVPVGVRRKPVGGKLVGTGEPFQRWQGEIRRMHQAIEVWKVALRKKRKDWQSSTEVNALRRLITKTLKGRVSPRLLWDARSRLGLYVVPENLLGAMWLQLARAVNWQKKYERCEGPGCGKVIEISLDESGNRADCQYCSGACRQKAYRQRKREGARGKSRRAK